MYINMGQFKIIISPEVEQTFKGTIVIRIEQDEVRFLSSDNQAQYRSGTDILRFMDQMADRKEQLGSMRTADTYRSASRRLASFLGGKQLMVDEVTSSLAEEYEGYLKREGMTLNSVSFYLRILRAAYNEAVREGLAVDTKPFAKVYTGVARTSKRALSIDSIRKIFSAKVKNDRQRFARDLFMFSFLTRGMSFVDMAHLTKENLKGNILTYRRRKTGQTISVLWLSCMQDIVDRYPSLDGRHLLGILDENSEPLETQYRKCQMSVNYMLKNLCREIGAGDNVTMYSARHSWASIAKELDIPVAVISDGMGHDSVVTTQIYLNTISSRIDIANAKVISSIGIDTSVCKGY